MILSELIIPIMKKTVLFKYAYQLLYRLNVKFEFQIRKLKYFHKTKLTMNYTDYRVL